MRGPRGQPYIKQMTAIMKFGLYVLCRNVAVEWPFGYRFGLAPVKARDENLPDRIAVKRICSGFCTFFHERAGWTKKVRFSEAAVTRKKRAADLLSAYPPLPQLEEGNGSNPL